MSLTSYRAAPPRVIVFERDRLCLRRVFIGLRPLFCVEKIVILLRFADLAATDSPAS